MTVDASASPLAGRRQATTALMIATAMQAFDATIANVALPQLERGFGGAIELGSWVMTSWRASKNRLFLKANRPLV